jgi:glutaredoxin
MEFIKNKLKNIGEDKLIYLLINNPNKLIRYKNYCIKLSNFEFPNKKGFTIYGYSYCPYSKKAIEACKNLKHKYKFIQIDDNKNYYQKCLNGYKGYNKERHATFPIIYRNDMFIGGSDSI